MFARLRHVEGSDQQSFTLVPEIGKTAMDVSQRFSVRGCDNYGIALRVCQKFSDNFQTKTAAGSGDKNHFTLPQNRTSKSKEALC